MGCILSRVEVAGNKRVLFWFPGFWLLFLLARLDHFLTGEGDEDRKVVLGLWFCLPSPGDLVPNRGQGGMDPRSTCHILCLECL